MSRSAYDPVPRFLSGRAQALLTAVLILGIGVSVFEYLESSISVVRAGAAAGDRAPVEAAPTTLAPRDAAPACSAPASPAPATCVRARATPGTSHESAPATWSQPCPAAERAEEARARTSASPMSFEPETEFGG